MISDPDTHVLQSAFFRPVYSVFFFHRQFYLFSFLIKLYYLIQILPTKIWAYGSPRHTERALYPLSYGKTHGKQGHLHKFYTGHTAVMIRNDESLLVLKEKKFHARWWMRRMSHLSSWPTKWQKINPLKRLRSRLELPLMGYRLAGRAYGQTRLNNL